MEPQSFRSRKNCSVLKAKRNKSIEQIQLLCWGQETLKLKAHIKLRKTKCQKEEIRRRVVDGKVTDVKTGETYEELLLDGPVTDIRVRPIIAMYSLLPTLIVSTLSKVTWTPTQGEKLIILPHTECLLRFTGSRWDGLIYEENGGDVLAGIQILGSEVLKHHPWPRISDALKELPPVLTEMIRAYLGLSTTGEAPKGEQLAVVVTTADD